MAAFSPVPSKLSSPRRGAPTTPPSDRRARRTTWVAPRQSGLGPRHHAFAARILKAKGTLLIWAATAGTTRSHAPGTGHTLTLARCTGTTRNGSRIAGMINRTSGEAWLLTGDAGYHELALTMPPQLSTVVAPHHCADIGANAPVRPRLCAAHLQLRSGQPPWQDWGDAADERGGDSSSYTRLGPRRPAARNPRAHRRRKGRASHRPLGPHSRSLRARAQLSQRLHRRRRAKDVSVPRDSEGPMA